MACKEEKYIVLYMLRELGIRERITFKNHLRKCRECSEILNDFKAVEEALEKRPRIDPPDSIVEDCKVGGRRLSYIRERKVSFIYKPAWAFVLLMIVFAGGFLLGRFEFNRPDKTGMRGRVVYDSNDFLRNKAFRDYLLSVEAFFLNMVNMDNLEMKQEEDEKTDIRIMEEVLSRTRRIKELIPEHEREIYRLVVDIEMLMEDALNSTELDMAYVPKMIDEYIKRRGILTKIYNYIS